VIKWFGVVVCNVGVLGEDDVVSIWRSMKADANTKSPRRSNWGRVCMVGLHSYRRHSGSLCDLM
jgi:hypothetical protein